MRTAFIENLTRLASANEAIHLITSDTGFKVFDDFKETFPDRYLNIGISESALIGLAAGLALSGKTVFVYGIVPFVTMRCFEQIRNDLCFENLPVRIAGVGAGLTYGSEGPTHHSVEDIAIMSALPNMTVVCPGDPVEAGKAVEASMDLPGPLYLRLGKSGEKVIHHDGLESFRIGRAIEVRSGHELALISTGNMLETAVGVHERLALSGLSSAVISMHTVKPIDRGMLRTLAINCRLFATLEEHNVCGGLGSTVAEVITEERLGVDLVRFALPDRPIDFAGSQDYLRGRSGLSTDHIAESLLKSSSR